jgi:condensin-2 complex subunit D3
VLTGPLLAKQPRLFANQFVESLFVLNCCTAHPIFKAAAALGDGGSGITVGFDGISLTAEVGRVRRMYMYELMLSKMSDEDKIGVTARIAKEVLGGALKNESELNIVAMASSNSKFASDAYSGAFNVLSDALAILKCPQMRVGKGSRNVDEDDIEDPNVTRNIATRVLAAKGRLLSNVSRKHLIEILMPILCNLKSLLEKSRSPLLKDLMVYLLDVYHQYKNEVQECLANDPTTLQEIEYDARQHKLQSRRAAIVSVGAGIEG